MLAKRVWAYDDFPWYRGLSKIVGKPLIELIQPLKGSRFHHPKQATFAELPGTDLDVNPPIFTGPLSSPPWHLSFKPDDAKVTTLPTLFSGWKKTRKKIQVLPSDLFIWIFFGCIIRDLFRGEKWPPSEAGPQQPSEVIWPRRFWPTWLLAFI